MKVKEKFKKKLLVEGKDDQHVVWALCEKFKIPETYDVIDCEGIQNILEQIPVRFKESEIRTIGIIIDADQDILSRWNAVKSIFTSAGFQLPEKPPLDGLIVENTGIRIGVWVMPDNNTNGMIEDFIAFLIPDHDKLLPVAVNTLQSIEDQGINSYSKIHKSKAIIHTWLAWQADPGTPMGLAITKKYLSSNDATCERLVKWLKELFAK